jgi:hypothetical protein
MTGHYDDEEEAAEFRNAGSLVERRDSFVVASL